MSSNRHVPAAQPGPLLAIVLTVLTGLLVSGGLAAAAAQLDIDDSMATLIALAMAVASAGATAGWLVHRRGDPGLGARLQLLGILTTAGVTRHLDLGPAGQLVAGFCWLAAPVAGLTVASALSGRRPGAARLLLPAAVVLAGATAVTGGEVGPGSWTTTTVGADIPGTAWLLAVAHVAALTGAAVAIIGWRTPAWTLGFGSEVVVRGWAIVAVAGATAHLLPGRWLFASDGYRPWAETLALKVPLVATLAVLAAVAYDRALRPWLSPEPDRVALDPARLPSLDADLARWTADPTVQLTFPAPGGGWSDSTGRPVAIAGTAGPDRVAVILTRGGKLVARIEHDADLAAQPGLVDYDVRLVSAVLSAERDAALAAERLAEARRANTRLLQADDDARAALRAQLAAGPVATLERLAADRAVDLVAAADCIRQVAAEVRELSHGLYPPELATGGLTAALPLAAGLPGRRLPPAVEVTAYLIAAGRPDAVLDDRGAWLTIRLDGPTDLPVERIEALGGSVRPIVRPDSEATRAIAVELPTAWE